MTRARTRTRPLTVPLDGVDRRLLLALSRDGRQAASSLAKELRLSRQAVAGRIRDLERRGVVRGYRADLSPESLGLAVRAQIRLSLDGTGAPESEKVVLRHLKASPLVRSVYRVSGEDCFVAQVVCREIEEVNALLKELQATRAIQSSRTAFVLETILEKGALGPVEDELIPEQTLIPD